MSKIEVVFALLLIVGLSYFGFHGNREVISDYVSQGELLSYEFFLFWLFNLFKTGGAVLLFDTIFSKVRAYMQSSSRTGPQ